MTHQEVTEQLYEWECPECQYSYKETNSLVSERVKYCGMCAMDTGRDVRIKKWLPKGVDNEKGV